MEKVMVKQVLLLLLIAFILVFLFTLVLHENVYGQERERERIEQRYYEADMQTIVGDYRVDRDQVVETSLLLRGGTLVLAGDVLGNAVVMDGDVELDSTAYVEGDVVSVAGKIWMHPSALVGGDIIEIKASSSKRGESYYKEDEDSSREDWDDNRFKSRYNRFMDPEKEAVYVSYDRVDGLSLGLRLPHIWHPERRNRFQLLGKLGYSFSSKRTQYRVGLERRQPFGSSLFAVGAELHHLVDTQDRWIISDTENSLAAFFLREDFRDYYLDDGYSFFLRSLLSSSLSMRLFYQYSGIENIENKTNWSLFGGDKKFPPNPAALPVQYADGEQMSLRFYGLSMTYDSRDDDENPERGFLIHFEGQRSGYGLNSDLEFQRYTLDIRRYQPLNWEESLSFRLRAATSTGTLPPVYLFDLGGISTLRGYPFKAFSGNRMLLVNLEYQMLPFAQNWFFGDSFGIILFVDTGTAWTEDQASQIDDGWRQLVWSDLKTNVGIALADRENTFRINFSKPTDQGADDIVITFRIRRPF
jgi:hypothetical protein